MKPLSKHFFLGVIGGFSTLTIQAQKPNIIIIQADDLGYDDLSIHGTKCVETPNLDNFSRESVNFERFYVNSLSCPSRASFLTGRQFLRTGVSGVHGGRDFMNLDEVTIAEAFRQAGYKTGMWGKWHVGKTDGYYPWDRGFDEAYMAELYQHENNKGLFNGKEMQTHGWVDSIATNMAIRFIETNKNRPFFAYLPYLTPHGIWHCPETSFEKYKKRGQSDNFATLNGMINHLDVQIGRLLKRVKELGIDDNTIILFMSDNGPVQKLKNNMSLTKEEWAMRNPTRLKGQKATNWENGIRSPLFVKWGNHYKPGKNYNLIDLYDIYPTLADMAGVKIPENSKKLDGISFKKCLTKPDFRMPERSVYIAQWYPLFSDNLKAAEEQYVPISKVNREKIVFENQVLGLQHGDYKLLYNQRNELPLSLRKVSTDIREEVELYDSNKLLADKLFFDLKNWYQGILEDESSYQMPVFQIGFKGHAETEILCYAPYEISKGIINDELQIKNFSRSGDFAEYKVKVHTPGTYRMTLNTQKIKKGVVARLKISTSGKKEAIITIDGKNASKENLYLASTDQRVRIEVLETNNPIDLTTLTLVRI